MNNCMYTYTREKREYAYIYIYIYSGKKSDKLDTPPPINPVTTWVRRRVRGCVQLLNENEVRTWKKTSSVGWEINSKIWGAYI